MQLTMVNDSTKSYEKRLESTTSDVFIVLL